MAMFGATISAYNKKPSSALTSFQQKATAPPVVKPTPAIPTVPDYLSVDKQKAKPLTTDPTKSALDGSSNLNASAMIQTPNTQSVLPQDSGSMGIRSSGSEYSRLNAIDETTNVLNDEMARKVGATNQGNQGNSQWGGGNLYSGGDGSGLSPEQLNYARQIASVGKARGMDDNAIRIALMTSLAESGLRNLNYGDRDSVGLFQQRTSQGWGSVQQIMDPNYSANKFYDALSKTNYKAMSPWQAAQAVQRSFDPTGSNYQKQYALAMRAFQSLTPNAGGMAGAAPNQAAGFIQNYNNKYLDFDGRYGAQCVDLFNFYNQNFVGAQRFPVAVASQLFNAYDTTKYTRFSAMQTPGRMGDAAIFRGSAAIPAGHVAIVVKDNGDGTLRVLQSNATAAGSAGNSVISNISKSLLMGYLRPNRLM